MKRRSSSILFRHVALLSFLLLLLAACTHRPQPVVLSPMELQQAYAMAVKDAQTAEPHEVSRNLVAVVPSNGSLRWNPDTGAVLVTTWTAWDGYDGIVGRPMALSRPVWVTTVPEVRSFCQERCLSSQDRTVLRLEQLLGLPPGNGKTRFVEMWVLPQDLFRPSPDPEVSDHEAELDFPVSERFTTISDEHRRWFHDLSSKSYGPDGYPWTRLGYTYDWGNPVSEIGLSEFVIRAGATVMVYSVTRTMDYCR